MQYQGERIIQKQIEKSKESEIFFKSLCECEIKQLTEQLVSTSGYIFINLFHKYTQKSNW
jgi:hypothetical protein